MKIVIIEDEIRIREGIANLLHKISHDCQIVGEAANGMDGLELIERTHPDLVITDIKMPQMDGLEMLSSLYERKIRYRAIVLSAYSEFAYAQQAIKLGVSEYLLKPISLEQFSTSIRNIEAQIAHERTARIENPQQLHSLDQILYGILFSSLPIDNELGQFLESVYQMSTNGFFSIVEIYLGAAYDQKKGRLADTLKLLLNDFSLKYQLLELPQNRETLLILYSMVDLQTMEKSIQNEIVPRVQQAMEGVAVFGWIAFEGLIRIKESYGLLRHHIHWNIALGQETMISYPRILQMQPKTLSYPVELEKRAKNAICDLNYAALSVVMQQFLKHLQSGIYNPAEIKETVVRFLWAIINILKEIDYDVYMQMEQQTLLEKIMTAITWAELSDIAASICESLLSRQQEHAVSLQVRRAINMMHEYYALGITLDEIAAKLNVTPEYLGTQFHKEVGENFNSCIKQYRIKKAKGLLIGTDMKLFDISSAVGYSDPKYFSRVFRDITGQLPADYRKLHK